MVRARAEAVGDAAFILIILNYDVRDHLTNALSLID